MIIFSYDMPLRQTKAWRYYPNALTTARSAEKAQVLRMDGDRSYPGEPEKTAKDLLLVMSQKIYTF